MGKWRVCGEAPNAGAGGGKSSAMRGTDLATVQQGSETGSTKLNVGPHALGLLIAAIAAATGLYLIRSEGLSVAPAVGFPLVAVGVLTAQAIHLRRALPEARGHSLWRTVSRLSGVWVLSAVFLAIIAALAMLAVIGIAYGVAWSGPGFVSGDPATWAPAATKPGRAVLGVTALAAAASFAWVAARISLAPTATVAQAKVQVLATWPLSRRRVGQIILAHLVSAALPLATIVVLAHFAQALPMSPNDRWLLVSGVASVAVIGPWSYSGAKAMTRIYRAAMGDRTAQGVQ